MAWAMSVTPRRLRALCLRLIDNADKPIAGRRTQSSSGLDNDEASEIVDILSFDELDRKAGVESSDHPAHAGPDRQRCSDRQLHFS